ncbi:hypothetical protein [Flavobacterium sp.]|jgi:hypothetical protein|uniref:hypothetical protein n=1 Tax=Flavobacterium sp. TaxID=239 RepID=UPI0022BD82EA|nr:hypothetical protein [Flavobacterium sp.]MCZ8143767.1 hypothetical protein [Flavobacterium sp.]MCZ8368339.1 hypothetical protein [Flavobacterium sp.]
MKKLALLLLPVFFLIACNNKGEKPQKIVRAFYYWKSSEDNYDSDVYLMDTLKVEKLYFKVFEVKRDATLGNIPISKTNFYSNYWATQSEPKKKIEFIPTIFIRNDVFIKSSRSEIDTLVSNVYYLSNKYMKEKFTEYHLNKEIQIDCDWTLKSKSNYFYFLEQLRKVSKKKVSCTLRLYPYKYQTKMGIPPVDRVTLMCYNLLQPFEDKKRNSILDIDELEAYLTVEKAYPVPLDVALPVFNWAFHYQYDQFRGFTHLSKKTLKSIATQKSELWWEIQKDTTISEVYYRIGDKIKMEDVTQDKLFSTINLLKSKVKFPKETTVTFFDLDSTIVHEYSIPTLHRFYTSFTK